jgi:hypothetical protein
MNCEQCLEELSTTSLREMPADSPAMQHCATCPDCAGLTTRLREREYEAATLLNGLPPLSSPLTVAQNSALLSRRRRVGRMVVTLSGIAGAIIIAVAGSAVLPGATHSVASLFDAPAPARLRTETIPLTCLSPEQAADIINPYVRSHGSTYYTPTSGISAITVRGTGEELARSRNLIHDFENDPAAACHRAARPMNDAMEKAIRDALSEGKPVIGGPDVSPSPSPSPSPSKRK